MTGNETKTGKPWYAFATLLIGKVVRAVAKLRGGGTAFPGKVVESIDPTFLSRTLAQLPFGVILVSGTNGKTTTTRMVATMLEESGLKVFTNPTGSNFTRGVVSALLSEISISGKLNADIAVLELDEAYAVHFCEQVKPQYSLLLNVMRDQLDRFGEIDNTARLLSHVAAATTGTVVLNREDPRISALASVVKPTTKIAYFGLEPALRSFFPSDDDMHSAEVTGTLKPEELLALAEKGAKAAAASESTAEESATDAASTHDPSSLPADVTLAKADGHHATFMVDGREYNATVKLEGVYNLFNAAAALTVVRTVLRNGRHRLSAVAFDGHSLMEKLATVTPAFGRGENIKYRGVPIELVLVKNPMGFRLSLASFNPSGHDTMIVINDDYADGRDMSWLWDVDFTTLRPEGVAMVSGIRAWDMALRLGYDQVAVDKVQPEISKAVDEFVAIDPQTPKRIYCTYTAMLAVRSHLSSITEVEDVGL